MWFADMLIIFGVRVSAPLLRYDAELFFLFMKKNSAPNNITGILYSAVYGESLLFVNYQLTSHVGLQYACIFVSWMQLCVRCACASSFGRLQQLAHQHLITPSG
jgi:hypothetical protein